MGSLINLAAAKEPLPSRLVIDTNDAAILLEAQRAGVFSIASLDTDLRRAQADFDVYTWP